MAPILKSQVKTTTKGDVNYARLISDANKMRSMYAAIGILEPQRVYPETGALLGEVALDQEFGTTSSGGKQLIPSRSFIRTPVDQGTQAIVDMMMMLQGKIQDGVMTVPRALATVGADIVRRMQTAIKKRIDPALAEMTLKLRQERGITGTIPLYATGFLYRSIHFAVRSWTSGDSEGVVK